MVGVTTLAASQLSTTWYASGQRRRLALLAVLAVLGSLVAAILVLLVHLISVIFLVTCLGLVAIAWRPRLGLYTALGLVLLFENASRDPLMLPGRYFMNGLGGTVGLTGVIVSPLEMLLLLILSVWLAQGIARRRVELRGGRLLWPMILFLIALVAGLVRGAVDGGDLNISFWEARFLFYMVMCYFLAVNTIRTHGHLRTLTTIILLAPTLFSLEGAYRRVVLIGSGLIPNDALAYEHEDAIFLAAVALLVLAQQVFGAPRWQRIAGPICAMLCLFTMAASERRAAYIGLMVALLAFILVFSVAHRKAFLLIGIPLLVGGAVYVPLFWNNTSLIGQPARAIRSMYQPDARDASSNQYRVLEKINVRATIDSNPLLGVGFGRQFLFVVPMADLSWWVFWRYEPHHNILWVWLKTGLLGFIWFWLLMGSAIACAAYFTKTLREPGARIFAILALGGIVTSLVYCYVDVGLVSPRVTVFLGTLLGTVAILDKLPAPGEAGAAGEIRPAAVTAAMSARPAARALHSPRALLNRISTGPEQP